QLGEMVSYQQLATLAGNPKAAWAVEGTERNNPVPILIPCHRVLCSSRALGNYSGGPAAKKQLLAHKSSLAGRLAYQGASLNMSWARGQG
ncbi:MGMT methyltransferase, partial [Crocuta crocuta]